MKIAKRILLFILASATFAILSANTTSAADFASMTSKAAFEGFYQCWTDQAYTQKFNATEKAEAFAKKRTTTNNKKALFPYGKTNASNNQLSCKDLMLGTSKSGAINQGLLPQDIKSSTSKEAIKNFFAGENNAGGEGTMGYKAKGSGDVKEGQKTTKLTIKTKQGSWCRDKKGNLQTGKFHREDNNESYDTLVFPTLTKDNNKKWQWGSSAANNSGINVPGIGSHTSYIYYFCGDGSNPDSLGWAMSINDQGSGKNQVYYKMNVHSPDGQVNEETTITANGDDGYDIYGDKSRFDFNIETGTVAGSEVAEYDDYELSIDSFKKMGPAFATLNNKNGAGVHVELSKTPSYGDFKFTDQEVYDLYTYYIKEVFRRPIACEGDSNFEAYPKDGAVKWLGDEKECRVDKEYYSDETGNEYVPSNVHGVDSGLHFTKANISIEDIIATMNKLDYSKITTTDPNEYQSEGDSEGAEDELNCMTNAGGLGWIVCPIIELASNATQFAYSKMVEPYLSIDATLFDRNSSGGAATHQVWSYFQGFANLGFVLVFLFVIFSQLTGIGIDNYGVKKILPKLIIGAVLINLSYLICQLSVDLSNILGRAMRTLFENGANTIAGGTKEITFNLNEKMGATAVQILTESAAFVGVVGVLSVPAFLAMGPGILISVLLSVLAALFSVLFLFIMLALRQSIAVVLVTISPLAFALYILPNTKKIYEKWFTAFKGMLIAYPIASALVYGGDFVSKILLLANGGSTITSLGLSLSAVAASIAPIFFIPGLIRTGMNGIAGLGNMLNSGRKSMTSAYKNPANDRLKMGRLGDYQRRRAATLADAQIERKGRDAKKYLDAHDNIDPSTLKGSKRVRYRESLRNMAAMNKAQSEIGGMYVSTLSNDTLRSKMREALKTGDMESFRTHGSELGRRDQEALTLAMRELSGQKEWKNMNNRELTEMNAFMASQGSNPILKNFSKINIGNAGNVRSLDACTEEIKGKIRESGADSLASADKDVIKAMGKNDSLATYADAWISSDVAKATSSDQMSSAAKAAWAQFAQQRRTNSKADAAAISNEQFADLNISQIAAAAGASSEQVQKIASGKLDLSTGIDANGKPVAGTEAGVIVQNIQQTFKQQLIAGSQNSKLGDKMDAMTKAISGLKFNSTTTINIGSIGGKSINSSSTGVQQFTGSGSSAAAA